MKSLQLPKNKLVRLAINIFAVIIFLFLSFFSYAFIANFCWVIEIRGAYYTYPLCALNGMGRLSIGIPFSVLLIWLSSSFLVSRFIWFEKSRNRIFYGLFDKLKTIRKFEPRIYTTTSNADELKKYSDLRDQGIITEEEFQSKKKKLLDL